MNLIDPDGRQTSEQRSAALAKAEEYVTQNPGGSFEDGAKGNPGQPVDCSGLITGVYPNVFAYSSDAWRGTEELLLQTMPREDFPRRGDLVFFGKYYTHVGVVTDITEDQILFTHSGTKNGPVTEAINMDGSGYWAPQVHSFRYKYVSPKIEQQITE